MVPSHRRQVREDECPKFSSKDEDEGLNTEGQVSADWPGIGGSEGECGWPQSF